jgi:ribosome-binding factor A
MVKEFSRGQRIADLIQRELAILIQREMKDPRLGMVTINDVKVSRDISYADVYFTVIGHDDSSQVEQILNNAGGFLRGSLAKVMTTRITPRLRFHFDQTTEQGARLDKAISDAIKSDRKRH